MSDHNHDSPPDKSDREEKRDHSLELNRVLQKLDRTDQIIHDFMQPVTAALGNLDLLMALRESPEKGEILSRDALKDTYLAVMLIAEYIRSHRHEVRCKVDLEETINALMPILRAISPHNVVLSAHKLCIGSVFASIMPTLFKRVLMDLVANAFEAIADKQGSVEVNYGIVKLQDIPPDAIEDFNLVEKLYAFACVTDSGSGVDAEHSEKAGKVTFTTKKTGTGQGLLITRRFVTGCSGGFCMKNREDAQGTCVHLYLPMSDRSESRDSRSSCFRLRKTGSSEGE